jgi:hypothetical protein
MPRGGPRPNSGPKKGAIYAPTVAKAAAREIARQLITARLEPIIDAHVRNAIGLDYMVIRHEDGTFTRAQTEADIDAALKRGGQAFQIVTQQPNTQSMQTLLAYALDKPKEQEFDVNLSVTDTLQTKINAARARRQPHQ